MIRVVAAFSSIGEPIELIVSWSRRQPVGTLMVVLGPEPFSNTRSSFVSARIAFADEVHRFWLEHGMTLPSSAKLLRAIEIIAEPVSSPKCRCRDWFAGLRTKSTYLVQLMRLPRS